VGTKCIWSSPTFFQLAVIFRCALWETDSASTDLLAEFKGEGKKSREWNGWNMGGTTTGDGGRTKEEKEGIHSA